MRTTPRLILTLAVAAAVGTWPVLAAQPSPRVVVRPLSSDLVALTSWAKKVSAAQQPALEVYARCQPVSTRAAAAFGDRAAGLAVIPDLIRCAEDFEIAARRGGQALAAVGPMPKSVEAAFKIDSADYLQRNADVLLTMAAAFRDLRTGLEAVQAGDQVKAQASLAKMQRGTVAAIDAQILGLELIAKTAPNRLTRALFDMRLITSRAMRAALAAPASPEGIDVGDSLMRLAIPARATAKEILPGWTSDSAAARRILARMNDPRRKALLAQADATNKALSARADLVATALEHAPVGTVFPSTLQAFVREMAQFDIFVVQAAASMSNSVQGQ